MKLLAKNPVNRYPTAEDLRNDLRRYQQGAHDLKPSSPVGATGRKLQHPVSVSKSPKQERVRRDDGFRRTALFTVFMGILLVVFGYLVVQFLDTIGVEDDGDTSIELIQNSAFFYACFLDVVDSILKSNFNLFLYLFEKFYEFLCFA